MLKKNHLCVLFLLLMFGFSAAAQQKYSVKGIVVDKNNQPIVGASVVEKGTSIGVSTLASGEFTLAVSSANATLEISFLGYITKAVVASSIKLTQPIVLEDDVAMIDEVVVIGYGTVRKTDLTGSVVAIRAEELNRGAVTSAQDMIMGKVPGVYIVQGNGGPGSGSTIRIRGGSSLNASNDPLIVIDGVPIAADAAPGMANPLNAINPNDIESFTVLKDASATAIYGSRASNGVIIINTKRGKGKELTLSYNSSYSVSVNSKTVPTMSATEYREFMEGFYPAGTPNGDAVRNLMGTSNTDWQDLIYRPAFATDQSISAYGNYKEMMPYRASLGYTNEDGTLKISNYQRYTADISLSPSFFKDHLGVTVNAKGTYNKNAFASDGAVNAAAFFDPTQDKYFRNADGSIDKSKTNGYWQWLNGDGTPNTLSPTNPLSILNEQIDDNDVYRLLGNVQLDYKAHFLKGLRFNLNLGMDATTTEGKTGVAVGSYQALRDGDAPGLGKYNEYSNLRRNELLEFYTAYAAEKDEHRFDVLGGYSWQHIYLEDNSITYKNDGTVFNDSPKYRTEYFLLSFFGRANYSYAGKYLATFSLRADASSRFSEDNRWGYFPSGALAWNVSEEDFLKDNSVISNLKLRLGIGTTGQQDLGTNDYPYLARYNLSTSPYNKYYLNGEYYDVLKPDAYDENIKWESTTTYNVGIDYGLLKGRITGSLDFYFRKTKDLLNTVSVPVGSNFSNVVTTNIGNMENKGIEFSVNAVVLQTQDLSWNVGFNATWQDTKITKLTAANDPDYGVSVGGIGGSGNNIQLHKVGYAPFSFFTYQQVYDEDGKPIQNALVDRNGDGILTEADRYLSGKSPIPDFYFGLNSKVNYKNWDFGFNAHASLGNWMFNNYYSGNATPVGDFMTQGFLVNLSRTVKKSGFTDKNSNGQLASDMFLEDASFFRMDDITLGYTFRKLAKTKMNLRLAFSVQNVFVITGYSGMDPEGSGIDNNIWPRPRIYSLRMSLNF